MDWIGDEVEELIRLRAEGVSMSKIAKAIGHGRNKNAILGKTFRLRQQGLIDGTAPSLFRRPPPPRSLGSYVIKAGGIRPGRYTKELALCYLRKNGLHLSDMAYHAFENGYETENNEHRLAEMLIEEASGLRRHYSTHDADILVERMDWNKE